MARALTGDATLQAVERQTMRGRLTVPMCLLFSTRLPEAALLALAGLLALVGLWFYEDAWVRAGQSVPLS